MENPEIPGRIQMERFIPVEIFRKKSNTFRGITFFPFLPKRPKFSVPFVWITSAKLHVKKKRKLYRYFVNGGNSIPFLFSVPPPRPPQKTSTIWRKFSTEISVQMVSAYYVEGGGYENGQWRQSSNNKKYSTQYKT